MALEMKMEVSWKRVGRVLFVLLVLIPVVACLGDWLVAISIRHVGVLHAARQMSSEKGANLKVEPIPDARIADLSNGTTIESFGYSIRTPCNGLSFHDDGIQTAFFHFGGHCAVIVRVKNFEMDDRVMSAGAQGRGVFTRLYGADALVSNYSFLKAELETPITPPSFFRSDVSNGKTLTILVFRHIATNNTDIAYSVNSERIHGFQFGDPRTTNQVTLTLFDQRDRDVQLVIGGPEPGQPGALTQGQINAIVASIVPPASF